MSIEPTVAIVLQNLSLLEKCHFRWGSFFYHSHDITNFSCCCTCFDFKGAGSRNVNNLLWKRRLCSIFDSPYHRDFPLPFSKYSCYFEDRLLNFVEKQTKHLYVVGLQRYRWIFRSNFTMDSPHPPNSERNTMAMCGQ